MSARQETSDQLVVAGVRSRGGPGRDIELAKDIAHVPVDRALAHAQLAGDALVRVAGGNQPKHVQLTRGERTGRRRRGARGVKTGEVGLGAKLGEDRSRGIELEPSRLVITERLTRLSDEHAHACRLVRRLEPLP